MIASIIPSRLKGNVQAPASKSAMQRACALALLHQGKTHIFNPGNSDDDNTALRIIKTLGAEVNSERDLITVRSRGKVNPLKTIQCGESGLSFRMFAAIAAMYHEPVTLEGSGSLLTRTMKPIDDIFPLLNVKTVSSNGYLPITVTGPLLPKNITIDGSSGSQYLTGLLFAYAASTQKPVTIFVMDLKSKPYIDLSIGMLRHFGYDVQHKDYKEFLVNPVKKSKTDISYTVEGDWSSASVLMVAAAIAGRISLTGLDIHSAQADRAILDVLKKTGASVEINNESITVSDSNLPGCFEFDATDSPDLFPSLVALAVYCKGDSIIKGVSRLAAKESNRGEALIDVFTKMGVDIRIENDSMIVKGGTIPVAAEVSSHHDHRIAMACAVAGLRASGKISVNDAEAVNKSYPAFFKHLRSLGAAVSLSW